VKCEDNIYGEFRCWGGGDQKWAWSVFKALSQHLPVGTDENKH